MCAPQRRTLFEHLNFQKCSERGVLCTFWLPNVLRANISTSKRAPNPSVFLHFWLRNVLCATTACTCSTAQLPKVIRTCGVLNFFTCKCASCHNGVQLFISHLTKWLRAPPLASLLFDPPEPQIIRKNTAFRDFPPFRAPRSSFFWLLLFADLLSSSLLLFCSLLFSDSSHLCFSSVHIVESFTSNFPSIICNYNGAVFMESSGGELAKHVP